MLTVSLSYSPPHISLRLLSRCYIHNTTTKNEQHTALNHFIKKQAASKHKKAQMLLCFSIIIYLLTKHSNLISDGEEEECSRASFIAKIFSLWFNDLNF